MPSEKKEGHAVASRKKTQKAVHPGSRKAARMLRENHKIEKRETRKLEKIASTNTRVTKLMWFRERIDEGKNLYSCADMCQLIERYLHRHDDDLEELEAAHSGKTRLDEHKRIQLAGREDAFRQVISREMQLYQTSGFEAPDLSNAKLFKAFLEWEGKAELLHNLKLRKYTSHLQKQGA